MAFGLILLIVLMAAFWAWSNRVSLIEDMAIDTLAEDGITAELSLDELTKTGLVLSGVKLDFGGETFFAAETIKARYAWREALNGKINRLEFTGAFAKAQIDENGKILDGWLPPGFGEETGDGSFPPEGILIKDTQLALSTPYGEAMVKGDIDLVDRENFTAKLTLAPTDMQRGEITRHGGGHIDNLMAFPI